MNSTKITELFSTWPSKDSQTDSMFLMSTPVPLMIIMAAYFATVFYGPRIMKLRSPMNLDNVLIVYNLFQVAMAANLCYIAIFKVKLFENGLLLAGCQYPIYSSNPTLLYGTWLFFFSKITELLDTVFFILRKKNNQVTFLHVYHHASMVVYMWSYLKYASAGDGAILAILNCIVHIIMYSYYLLAGLGPRVQRYLWWKKYVTKLQLVQFVIQLSVIINWMFFQPQCHFSKIFNGIVSTNIVIYLVLFVNFYFKSYITGKTKSK